MLTRPLSVRDLFRFGSKINFYGPIHPYDNSLGNCHEWTASKNEAGYGQFGIGSEKDKTAKVVLAHRLAFAIEGNAIEDGKDLCHSCDNPGCVNTRHLAFGTRHENVRQMIDRGRAPSPATFSMPGEANPAAVLCDDVVRKIRRDDRTNVSIAKELGVDPSTVGLVRRRRTWTHVL